MAEYQKLPSSQIPGFPTAVQRRDGSTSRGGSQKLGADNSPSTGGITLLGAQKSTTRPWPQCSYRRIFDDFQKLIFYSFYTSFVVESVPNWFNIRQCAIPWTDKLMN